MEQALRRQRTLVFALTWLAYASYYMCRQQFSVCKVAIAKEYSFSLAQLNWIDTGFLVTYAIGQFVSGKVCDRIGARRGLLIGMLCTACANAIFGSGSMLSVFAIAFTLNGIMQSTGWPSVIKSMTTFFVSKERGLIMGLWSTCYQLGPVAAIALATWLLTRYGWRYAFWVPALVVGTIGIVVGTQLPEGTHEARHEGQTSEAVFRDWRVWNLGAAYFFLKLIRYSLFFWLPYFLVESLHYSQEAAGYLSISFPAGGAVGAVIAGTVSDRISAHRGKVMIIMALLLAGAFVLFAKVAPLGPAHMYAGMVLVGLTLYGPDALLGVFAQDLGGARGAGSAAGIINGVGSVGAVAQGFVTTWVVKHYGWDAVFQVFVGMALVAALLLSPFVVQRTRNSDGNGLSKSA